MNPDQIDWPRLFDTLGLGRPGYNPCPFCDQWTWRVDYHNPGQWHCDNTKCVKRWGAGWEAVAATGISLTILERFMIDAPNGP